MSPNTQARGGEGSASRKPAGIICILHGTFPGKNHCPQCSLIAAAHELVASLDPDTLEAIADEIQSFYNSARCDSLRAIARKQRAALAKAGA